MLILLVVLAVLVVAMLLVVVVLLGVLAAKRWLHPREYSPTLAVAELGVIIVGGSCCTLSLCLNMFLIW